MGETNRIYTVIAQARRRLKLQSAFEAATTVAILAITASVTALYAYRMDWIAGGLAIALLAISGVTVLAAAAWGYTRQFSTAVVAARVDRAADLADRLGTACDFETKLRSQDIDDPETRAMMQAAIADAVVHAPRANAKLATPYHRPRDSGALGVFAAVASLIAIAYFPKSGTAPCTGPHCSEGPGIARVVDPHGPPDDPVELDDDDILYTRELLDELRNTAEQSGDRHLEKFVNDVEKLIDKAENGQLSKEQLLKELQKNEEKYMEGSDENIDESMADLKETGKELKQSPLTKELGKALERGDLEKAREEFEKLAQKLDSGELSDKDQKQAAKAFEKAADKFEKKQAKRDEQADKQIDEAKKAARRLRKEMNEAKDPEEKRRLAKKVEKKERELEQLERNKDKREASEQKRSLKRLHRNMRETAKNMRSEQRNSQTTRQQQSSRMKDMARDTGKVDSDRRKMNNQKRVASQVQDMKEALRRARQRGKGQRSKFGRNQRNRDFGQRARGGQGQRDAWRPGQKPGQGGPGKQGQGNKPGDQPGGQNYGNEDGGDPMGAPTAKQGGVKDEQLTGKHGRGPSTRETIVTAAQKGFASREYKKVYGSYKTIIEDVMRTEKVPSGYKYYIKRYFQKIKPQ